MKKNVYDHSGMTLLRSVEENPSCGDYCENCGECLHCGLEYCPANPDAGHSWVVYENDIPPRIYNLFVSVIQEFHIAGKNTPFQEDLFRDIYRVMGKSEEDIPKHMTGEYQIDYKEEY